jgi:hypothetical protein
MTNDERKQHLVGFHLFPKSYDFHNPSRSRRKINKISSNNSTASSSSSSAQKTNSVDLNEHMMTTEDSTTINSSNKDNKSGVVSSNVGSSGGLNRAQRRALARQQQQGECGEQNTLQQYVDNQQVQGIPPQVQNYLQEEDSDSSQHHVNNSPQHNNVTHNSTHPHITHDTISNTTSDTTSLMEVVDDEVMDFLTSAFQSKVSTKGVPNKISFGGRGRRH